ncbi:unnamed protein product [Anisakis simplex]|uniref:RNA-binding protein rnp-1 (inferred by orthology to a C. elegans protein) n=1 Tax=Anisakis simplex TaxID=6269 RepID=A0A0M3KFS8_ANISI|nr:unnamed protein product [Anisakis simplex]
MSDRMIAHLFVEYFQHVVDEDSARIAIEKLDGYILENKPINIRRSTSKLRREPGMDKRCYRCGAADHKTVQCPSDPSNQGNLKRGTSASGGQPITTIGGGGEKRFAADPTGSGTPTITINLTGRPIPGTQTQMPTSAAYNGYQTATQTAPPQQQSVAPQQLASVALSAADSDPELARPIDSDLIPLYEQYMESRTKYFYFRERLSKEMKARAHAMHAPINAGAMQPAPLQAPYNTALYGAATLVQQPQQPYAQQTPTAAVPYSTGGAAHFYANTSMASAVTAGGIYSTTQQLQPQPQLQMQPQPQPQPQTYMLSNASTAPLMTHQQQPIVSAQYTQPQPQGIASVLQPQSARLY